MAIEGLAGAARSAAFLVPAAAGAQEAAILAVGLLLGYDADLMLALALAKRVREVAVCAPGLIVWSATEGRTPALP